MKYLTPLLAAATLAVAAPTANHTLSLEKRGFQGSINWFARYDCKNPCVEHGYCLSGQVSEGAEGSEDPWIGWDNGCFDRPEGIHSLALSVSNGHHFSGIDKSCAQWKADNYDAKSTVLASGSKYGEDECTVFDGHHIKAVFYHWE